MHVRCNLTRANNERHYPNRDNQRADTVFHLRCIVLVIRREDIRYPCNRINRLKRGAGNSYTEGGASLEGPRSLGRHSLGMTSY